MPVENFNYLWSAGYKCATNTMWKVFDVKMDSWMIHISTDHAT